MKDWYKKPDETDVAVEAADAVGSGLASSASSHNVQAGLPFGPSAKRARPGDGIDGGASSDVGPAAASVVPQWCSFEPDATNWYGFMKAHGLDEVSMQEVMLVASLSKDGWWGANSILAKLAKKSADGDKIRNPSAFAHSCVKNCRDPMPNGWGFSGKP